MVIMKTIKQILLTIVVLLFSLTANAYDFEVDGIYYNIISATDFTAGVCKVPYGSEDYTGDIVIPSTVNYDGSEYSVAMIARSAFSGCTSLTSIEIPNSVTNIDERTFSGCTSLTSIEIPNSVTSIYSDAFSGCTSLKDLFIEDGYATLKLVNVFSNCPLETIYLGRNLSFANSENSEDLPFNNIKTLKTLTVGADVTEILGNTFYDCSNLESIYMKGVPPIIADDTFSNTSYYVTTLYVPEGTLAFYQTANVWKNFWNIQEYEPTTIEDVETDEVNFSMTSNGISLSDSESKPIAIYSINGILVKKIDNYTGEEITLNKGVYIVSVGNKAMKIML